jgi:hypothetical protein
MTTPRELLEAHSFERRRLLAALVSGAPAGREVEPSRPGRPVLGGVAITVLLVAGSAVSGVLAGRTEVDWDNPRLIVSKHQAAEWCRPPPQSAPCSSDGPRSGGTEVSRTAR